MTDREKVIEDVEQAIKILGNVDEPTFWLDFVRVAVERALKLLKEQLNEQLKEQEPQTVSGWVSVKDRLPGKKCACLVAINSVWRALDFWECDGWAISDEKEITHWMPLPEPPKEDDA